MSISRLFWPHGTQREVSVRRVAKERFTWRTLVEKRRAVADNGAEKSARSSCCFCESKVIEVEHPRSAFKCLSKRFVQSKFDRE